MKKIKKVRDVPQDINTILFSFERYALEDIRQAKERPISTFILSICFIDQLSTFLYEFKADDAKKPERFFAEFMPQYAGINLFHKARHTIVHNYSSRGQFDIDNRNELFSNVPYVIINDVIHINTNVFVEYLEIAYKEAKKAILDSKGDADKYSHYNNALENSMYYPVLVDTLK